MYIGIDKIEILLLHQPRTNERTTTDITDTQ